MSQPKDDKLCSPFKILELPIISLELMKLGSSWL